MNQFLLTGGLGKIVLLMKVNIMIYSGAPPCQRRTSVHTYVRLYVHPNAKSHTFKTKGVAL